MSEKTILILFLKCPDNCSIGSGAFAVLTVGCTGTVFVGVFTGASLTLGKEFLISSGEITSAFAGAKFKNNPKIIKYINLFTLPPCFFFLLLILILPVFYINQSVYPIIFSG